MTGSSVSIKALDIVKNYGNTEIYQSTPPNGEHLSVQLVLMVAL